jgi:secreted PhoX family phosphatase
MGEHILRKKLGEWALRLEEREADEHSNPSSNRTFEEVLSARLSRRTVLKAGATAAAAGFMAPLVGLPGCASDDPRIVELGFDSIATQTGNAITLPPGYTARVLFAYGDPIAPGVPAFRNDGTDAPETFAQRAGTGHDGLRYYSLPNEAAESSDRGLLVMNHENVFILGAMHEAGPPTAGETRVLAEVEREIAAHGVSVVEIRKNGMGDFEVVQDSSFNRRITGDTPMTISGPAAGHPKMQTRFSPDGTGTRGTLNNCAMGYTPWGTYLTCEENWHGYFRTDEDPAPPEKARYGVNDDTSYRWETAGAEDRFTRFDTSPTGASATDDFRNEANTFGWVVEIDPYDPSSTPVKRTHLGRIKHEGCWPAPARSGAPVVFYTGDDERGEYIYKFVSAGTYVPGRTDGSILDSGTLYVAVFNEDGTGEWRALTPETTGFADLGDMLINTRTAADAVGATPMDRPEWGAVNPANGEVYMTLTNNRNRGDEAQESVDAANPRPNNPHGHIIRWRETGDDPTATTFRWDIFLFGADPNADQTADNENLSGLDGSNFFASPDGLWFDDRVDRGLIWIQTDDSSLRSGGVAQPTNNQLLVAIPGEMGDGDAVTTMGGQSTFRGAPLGPDRLRRFLVGPAGCEITGIDMTPDGATMFINIQHPGGEVPAGIDPTRPLVNNWPNPNGDATAEPLPIDGLARPRPATVVIRRVDGGRIGDL